MPADIIIGNGLFVSTRIAGKGNDGFGTVPVGIRSGTGSVSLSPADYAKVYVADLGPGQGNKTRVIAIVPKVAPDPGSSYTVTVTATGKDDASGQTLTPMVLSVEVEGPPPVVPAATDLDFFALNSNAEQGISSDLLANAPPDPGSSSISF
jgi:hypothetical protein